MQEILDDTNQRDSENVTLLHWAPINNRRDLVRLYITSGSEVDAVGGELLSTPLHWASRQGHIGVIVQLMAAGANPALRDCEDNAGGCNDNGRCKDKPGMVQWLPLKVRQKISEGI